MQIRRMSCMTLFVLLALSTANAFAQEKTYPENSVVVVATPGFPWAAEDVSKVLGVRATPLDVGLVEAADIAKAESNVLGVVEVQVNVSQFYETVYAICRDDQGREIWRQKRMLNFGGGQERLARDMVRGLLKKVNGKKCP